MHFSPSFHYFLGPRVLLSTLFSDTLNLNGSVNVRSEVSYPYKPTGEIIVLYVFKYERATGDILWRYLLPNRVQTLTLFVFLD
jgi:hypothetical protein